MDCWVVVWVTSLRDWLDNAAVERAPVLPLVQNPPLRAIPVFPPPAVVGQKIWASALDVNPTTSSGTRTGRNPAVLPETSGFQCTSLFSPGFVPKCRIAIVRMLHVMCDLGLHTEINVAQTGTAQDGSQMRINMVS